MVSGTMCVAVNVTHYIMQAHTHAHTHTPAHTHTQTHTHKAPLHMSHSIHYMLKFRVHH